MLVYKHLFLTFPLQKFAYDTNTLYKQITKHLKTELDTDLKIIRKVVFNIQSDKLDNLKLTQNLSDQH